MVVVDTNIASMFAKIDAVDLLIDLFHGNVFITPKIRDELSVSLEYGYTFPLKVISKINTVPLTNEILEEYATLQNNVHIERGELEAIAYCKVEKDMFATNDKRAREFAKNEGIFVISLQAILKSLWKGKRKSKKEVKQILEKMEISVDLLTERSLSPYIKARIHKEMKEVYG